MKHIFSLIFLCLCTVTYAQPSTGITLRVHVKGINKGKAYLYEVQNVFYNTFKVLDTLQIENGQAMYQNDTLRTGLYALSPHKNPQSGKVEVENHLFLQTGENYFQYTILKESSLVTSIHPTEVQGQYETFQRRLKEINAQTDSLDRLFYAARDRGDRAEMARIKSSSISYYETASTKRNEYILQSLNENDDNTFGLFLFYAYRFQNKMFNSLNEINRIHTKIASYNKEAKESIFAHRMEEALKRSEKCAIGHVAPEIEGITQSEGPIKLSDFKGKWVLVDFWSSGCRWCRLENKYLKSVYETYKGDNFTILGVSSDYRKEDWLKAIEVDKTPWNHLLIPKENIRKVKQAYGITGIPHILLVNPEGIIIAKELRGEEIEQAIIKYVKGAH